MIPIPPPISESRDMSRPPVSETAETQPSSLSLKVTILRAYNLPLLGKRNRFYASVADGARTWRTRAVQSVGNRAEWNENVDIFAVKPLSRITISLYAKRAILKDILVGRQEIVCEPQREVDIILGRNTTEPASPYLTITVSSNATLSVTAADSTLNPASVILDNPAAEGSTARVTDQVDDETVQHAAVTPPLSPLHQTTDLPVASDTPVGLVADSQAEMTLTALRHAEDAIDTMKTWSSAVETVKRVMDAVSPIADLNTHAKLAWKLLSMIPETLLKQVQRDNNIKTLLETIRDAFEFTKEADALRNIKPESMQAKILEDMLLRVYEFAKFIESYAKDIQAGMRTLKNIGSRVDGDIEHYSTILIRLRDNCLAHAAVTTEVTVLRMQDNVGKMNVQLREMANQALETELDAKIREMPYKGGWRFGDEKRCLPGTREDFLDFILKWVENPESERGLVLLGQAGTGKSSIAHEVARRLEKTRLGSYFAFLRKEQSKDEAYQLFTTLARDLSDRYPAFKLALGQVIKDNSSLRGTRDYRTLFEYLLLEPLKNLQLGDPIVIVIDALDESGDAIGKSGLHTFLAQHLFDLPPKFRMLITSRPENGVEPAFASALSVRILQMDDAILSAKTEQDIGLYLEKELPPRVYRDYGIKLAKASEGLFQWAAVACGFINNPPATFGFSEKKCVQRLLGHSRDRSGQDPLDKLYEEVLEGYFKPHEALILFRSVMAQVLAAIEPLSVRNLIALRRYAPIEDSEESGPVVGLLRHLGSLLSNVTSSDQTGPIIPLHTSFHDFLTNKKSDVFYVDLDDAHHQLAHSCVGLMLDSLKFNICELESSYLANSEVPDLESRISKHIPSALSYACTCWDDHLEHAVFEHELFRKLQILLESKFLFWLEVLSIKNRVGVASPALSILSIWLQRENMQTEVKSLLALVNDASAFVRYFGMVVARSAPHIYISALPFTPGSSLIRNQYFHRFPRTLMLERGQLSYWPALQMTIRGHREAVHSVAFSPDEQRIASGSRDRTIRVWDATTGQLVAGPLTGHTSSVRSVAFSPDGQRIASASDDRTIRVWDAATGQVVAGPFTGRREWVTSIVFSSNTEIRFASWDIAIRVLDAVTGQVVAGPFTGHTLVESVTCLAFSRDGPYALGLGNGMISVWIEEIDQWPRRRIIAGPFTGHIDRVRSIAISSDGKRIASASDDGTIRVWDVATGQIAGPFTGNTELITSIAFSLDRQRIAFASLDGTICVWDALTGQVVAGPFTAHTGSVTSVAFSPDGQRIASALDDCTILLLDATTGQVATGPFTGHTEAITSVAFSPDGLRIASASWDGTIRLLDATTGKVITDPIANTPDPFTDTDTPDLFSDRSVAFSPDGQHIAWASWDAKICVWSYAKRVSRWWLLMGFPRFFRAVAFSPDWQHIASASTDGTISMLDARTGQVVAGPFTVHITGGENGMVAGFVTNVAFSPNGQHIASTLSDGTICVLNAATGHVVVGPITRRGKSFTFTGRHTESVTFSLDGQRIVSALDDSAVCMWDATTGQVVAGPFTGHTSTSSVRAVTLSPSGQRIASASDDSTIRVWDATTGHVEGERPYTGCRAVAFSPDGRCIASASVDSTICVWDAITGRIVAGPFPGHNHPYGHITFSPDGKRISYAPQDDKIHVWDAATGQVIAGPFIGHTDWIASVVFSPDGELMASASNDGTIRIWDATTGQVIVGPLTGHTKSVKSVAFSPDGQCIASASDDSTIRIWSASTGQVMVGPFSGHSSPPRSVAFSPDGQHIISASYDDTICMWDAATGQLTAGPMACSTTHTSSFESTSFAFSPDRQHIASASLDGQIYVFDTTTGQVNTGPFTGQVNAGPFTTHVGSIAWSPDGQHIASASHDGTIRVISLGRHQTALTSCGSANNVMQVITEDIQKIHFTDQSSIDHDGWICGEGKELLLWIPELHRQCLHRPSTVWAVGERHDETRLDLSKFVHGPDWATVHDQDLSR